MGRAEITKDKYLKSIKISHNIYENQLDPAPEVEILREFVPAKPWVYANEREKHALIVYLDAMAGRLGAQLEHIIYDKEGLK
ncbi:MAG: hypothetical protein JKY67_08465 [Pseudomonadales bacterium]|nr:hypothetical protein [Pseudomonadales bacterium]